MTGDRSEVRLESHTPEVKLDPSTTKSAIVELLYRNDESGYKPHAVHQELDIPHNTAKGTLRRLKKQGYIDQTEDGYYHAREDREDLYRYVGGLDGLDRMFAEHDTDADTDEAVSDESSLSEDAIEDAINVPDNVE
ncbi:MarR family transcriptional regulator [Halosegnis longus]|uniref:MarR family transcriptional regulator n=1 Tax=Halosegnis longus TaxID=2216012 RepID=A0AAJ4R695_9EURY|nr:MarR family transcriptional regulator [Salella cibi]